MDQNRKKTTLIMHLRTKENIDSPPLSALASGTRGTARTRKMLQDVDDTNIGALGPARQRAHLNQGRRERRLGGGGGERCLALPHHSVVNAD